PWVGTSPCVGLSPTPPHTAEGRRMEPAASAPSAAKARYPATAAALPPLEPPADVPGTRGLRTGPYQGLSPVTPQAYSFICSLPRMTQPAARSRSTTVASWGATTSRWVRDPSVVTSPLTWMLSLRATGTPCSGP